MLPDSHTRCMILTAMPPDSHASYLWQGQNINVQLPWFVAWGYMGWDTTELVKATAGVGGAGVGGRRQGSGVRSQGSGLAQAEATYVYEPICSGRLKGPFGATRHCMWPVGKATERVWRWSHAWD